MERIFEDKSQIRDHPLRSIESHIDGANSFILHEIEKEKN